MRRSTTLTLRLAIMFGFIVAAMGLLSGCAGVASQSSSTLQIQSISTTGVPAAPGGTITAQVTAAGSSGTSLSYSWTVTSGWTIASGATTATVTITAPNTFAANGSATVTITDSQNNRSQAAVSLSTTSDPLPTLSSVVATPNPVAIQGTQTITATVSSSVNDTLTYTWTAPPGWTITQGQGTATLTITAPSSYGATGDVAVTVTNPSGGSVDGLVPVSTGTDIVASVEMTPTSQGAYLVGSSSANEGFALYGDKKQMFSVTAFDANHVPIYGVNAPAVTVTGSAGLIVALPSGNSLNVFGVTNVLFGTTESLTLTATPFSGSPVSSTVPILTRHNTIYLASSGSNTIDKYYDENTAPVNQTSIGDANFSLFGIAVAPNGTMLVPEWNGTGPQAVIYGGGTGSANQTILSAGLGIPQNACIDHEGNYYVTNEVGSTGNIIEYPASGQNTVINTYVSSGSQPFACAIDSNDGLWVVNIDNSTIDHFPAGTTTADQSWTLSGGLNVEPVSVATDRNNNLYVGVITVNGTSQVQVYANASSSSVYALDVPTPSGPAFAAPMGLVVDVAGNLWVGNYLEPSDCNLVMFPAPLSPTSTGTSTDYPNSTFILGMAINPSQP